MATVKGINGQVVITFNDGTVGASVTPENGNVQAAIINAKAAARGAYASKKDEIATIVADDATVARVSRELGIGVTQTSASGTGSSSSSAPREPAFDPSIISKYLAAAGTDADGQKTNSFHTNKAAVDKYLAGTKVTNAQNTTIMLLYREVAKMQMNGLGVLEATFLAVETKYQDLAPQILTTGTDGQKRFSIPTQLRPDSVEDARAYLVEFFRMYAERSPEYSQEISGLNLETINEDLVIAAGLFIRRWTATNASTPTNVAVWAATPIAPVSTDKKVRIIGTDQIDDTTIITTLGTGYKIDGPSMLGSSTQYTSYRIQETLGTGAPSNKNDPNWYDFIVIEGIQNDLIRQGVQIQTVSDNINQIARKTQAARDAGAKVIFTTILPMQGLDEARRNMANTYLRSMNGNGFIVVDLSSMETNTSYKNADGTLTDAGKAEMARLIAGAISGTRMDSATVGGAGGSAALREVTPAKVLTVPEQIVEAVRTGKPEGALLVPDSTTRRALTPEDSWTTFTKIYGEYLTGSVAYNQYVSTLGNARVLRDIRTKKINPIPATISDTGRATYIEAVEGFLTNVKDQKFQQELAQLKSYLGVTEFDHTPSPTNMLLISTALAIYQWRSPWITGTTRTNSPEAGAWATRITLPTQNGQGLQPYTGTFDPVPRPPEEKKPFYRR